MPTEVPSGSTHLHLPVGVFPPFPLPLPSTAFPQESRQVSVRSNGPPSDLHSSWFERLLIHNLSDCQSFQVFFFFFFLIRFRFDAVTVLVWYTLYKYMIMNIIICCQKSVFIHTGSSFSNSRAWWVLLSTFYIIIQKITTHQNVPS